MGRQAMQLGLIVNPSAGRVRRRYLPAGGFWQGRLPDHAVHVTRTEADLDGAVRDLRDRGVRVVACLGGDGTLHQLVNALLRHHPPDSAPVIVPLAGGTLNGLARALGTGGAAEQVLERALARLGRGSCPSVLQPTLRIEPPGAAEPLTGFTLAAGLAVRAARRYYASRPGPSALLRVTLAAAAGRMGNDKPAPRVWMDGCDGAASGLVVAGTVAQPVLWFRPFGTDRLAPGGFGITRVAMRPSQILPRLWPILRGRSRHPGITIRFTDAARIEARDGFLVDGEIHAPGQAGQIRLTCGPAMRIFDPS